MDSEEFVAQHLDQLPGKPKLIRRQFRIHGGTLDFLTQYDNGDFLVIEVKTGIISEYGWIQLLRYCGALLQHLELLGDSRHVKGMIIGKSLDERATFIFSALPRKTYQFLPLSELGWGE